MKLCLEEWEITQRASKTYMNIGVDENDVVCKIRIGSSLPEFSVKIDQVLPQIPDLFPDITNIFIKSSTLEEIDSNFSNLSDLKDFGWYCPKLDEFPSNLFQNLRNLERIDIQSDCISMIPSLASQKKLEILLLTKMPKLVKLPQSIGTSKLVRIFRLKNTAVKKIPNTISNWKNVQEIENLSCNYLRTLPDVFDHLSNLKFLTIEKCEGLVSLPPSLQYCPSLQKLKLLGCKNLVLTDQAIEAFDHLQLFLFEGKTMRPYGHMQLPDGTRLQVHPQGDIFHQLRRELEFEVVGYNERSGIVTAGRHEHPAMS